MNDIVVVAPKTLADVKELASQLAGARTLPEALQKSPADIMAIVMTGAELGLAPMQSIRGLSIIKGKPTLSADAMGALVRSRRDVCGFLMLRESTTQRATYETQRVGDPSPTSMSFSVDDAKTAGLNGDNWRKFPAAMLRARALSAICRAVYPDLLLGVYDPDELAEPRDSKGDGASAVAKAKEAVAAAKEKAQAAADAASKVVDSVVVSSEPVASAVDSAGDKLSPKGELCVGWGKHIDRTLVSLSDAELSWYVSDAKAKADAEQKVGPGIWTARLEKYESEIDGRIGGLVVQEQAKEG